MLKKKKRKRRVKKKTTRNCIKIVLRLMTLWGLKRDDPKLDPTERDGKRLESIGDLISLGDNKLHPWTK